MTVYQKALCWVCLVAILAVIADVYMLRAGEP